MFKEALASYYKNKKKKTKKRLKKSPVKGIKIFLKKEKTESKNLVVNTIKIHQKTKNKS